MDVNARKAANDEAQIKLKTELADLAKIAPKDRTPAQNERLQAMEIERQQLVKDCEAIDAELSKGSEPKKPHK